MKNVLTVGFDGSNPARRAVAWAAAEADRRRAKLQVVACYSITPMAYPWMGNVGFPGDIDLLEKAARDGLHEVAAEVSLSFPTLSVEQRAIFGWARDELVDAARESDLLIVGTTGVGAAESILLGSVAHAVARTSPCPVVLVPDAPDRPLFDRIVVGVDGSEASRLAAEWATDEADRLNAECVVLHAWSYPYVSELNSEMGHDLTRVDAELCLETAVERCRQRGGCPVRGELVEFSASKALVEASAQADLVVVGSRGRGELRSLLFGSVAHTVAQHASCPVVVIRAAKSGEKSAGRE
jgi:nucleotide-binding universal stress UspA family protein